MNNVIWAGLATFIFIFLKAFQQRNVAFDAPAYVVVLTSLCMAFAEVYVIAAVVVQGYHIPLIISVGIGGGVGAVLSMQLHKRIFRRGKACQEEEAE